MSNASLVYVKHDPAQIAQHKASAKKVVAQARSKGAKFATFVPVDGKGEAVSVVLHEPGSPDEHGAALTELHTKMDPKTGAKTLASGPRQGIQALKARTVTITSHGQRSLAAKPYALAFAVSYKPEKAADLRNAAKAISAHNPAFSYHVIRRDGMKGHAVVVVPVSNLTDLDKPLSAAAAPIAEAIKGAVTNVSLVKLKRVPGLSA
jgi:hypothetical protein